MTKSPGSKKKRKSSGVKVQLRGPFYREIIKFPALPRVGDRIEATPLAADLLHGVVEGTWLRVDNILFVPSFDYVIIEIQPPPR